MYIQSKLKSIVNCRDTTTETRKDKPAQFTRKVDVCKLIPRSLDTIKAGQPHNKILYFTITLQNKNAMSVFTSIHCNIFSNKSKDSQINCRPLASFKRVS